MAGNGGIVDDNPGNVKIRQNGSNKPQAQPKNIQGQFILFYEISG
jgi:hypothetical protein